MLAARCAGTPDFFIAGMVNTPVVATLPAPLPDSAPIKRLIQDSKDNGRAIDVTCGKRTRAVIITDSEHVILSAFQAETVSNRLSDRDGGEELEDADEPE